MLRGFICVCSIMRLVIVPILQQPVFNGSLVPSHVVNTLRSFQLRGREYHVEKPCHIELHLEHAESHLPMEARWLEIQKFCWTKFASILQSVARKFGISMLLHYNWGPVAEHVAAADIVICFAQSPDNGSVRQITRHKPTPTRQIP